ncbi:unnamed protein product [Gadus morhua 'NCC']
MLEGGSSGTDLKTWRPLEENYLAFRTQPPHSDWSQARRDPRTRHMSHPITAPTATYMHSAHRHCFLDPGLNGVHLVMVIQEEELGPESTKCEHSDPIPCVRSFSSS